MTGPPILEVEHLSVRYGAVRAVRDVSLTVHEHECVGIVGANGAGKSSFLSGVIGLVRPAGGQVTVCGHEVTGRRPESNVARGLVLVPERRQLFSSMSVEDNLRLGGYVRGSDRELASDIEAAEALFPILAQRRAQDAGTLSGGEQQMLAIARGLMAKPRILMIDEPSLGLAPVVVDAVIDALQQLHRQGMTLLIVEQNIRLANALAERLVFMEQGSVVREERAGTEINEEEVFELYMGGTAEGAAISEEGTRVPVGTGDRTLRAGPTENNGGGVR